MAWDQVVSYAAVDAVDLVVELLILIVNPLKYKMLGCNPKLKA
jgi:predicted KAP-like P-loop ATPase